MTPAGSFVSPIVDVRQEGETQMPSIDAVSQERENVLSPVKVEGEAVGEPVALSTLQPEPGHSDIQSPKVVSPDRPPVSSVDEPVLAGDTKVEREPAPLVLETPDVVKKDEDVKMEDVTGEATSLEPSVTTQQSVLSSQGIAAPAVAGLGGVGSSPVQGEETLSKRQRKSVSLGFNGTEGGKPALAGPESTSMTHAQIKFCQNAIKSLKGRPEAGAFLAPVDPIALNIPHYPNIIQEPMDLGTIDIRLALTAAASKGGSKPTEKTKQAAKWNLDPVRDVYPSVESFERDVRLVFGNCIRFNGPDHILSQSAKNLEAVFEKQLKTLPSATSVTPAAAESEANVLETPITPVSNGAARRPSDAASRPKRDIHPPAPKDLPWSDRPQSASATGSKKGKSKRPMTAREAAYLDKIGKDQIKFVSKIIDDMHKLPMSQYAWVFFEKPSRDLDFASSYYNLIKKPISLKEIKARLAHHEYDSVEGVKDDVDLMLSNCFLYNEKGSDVWTMGMEVKKAWEARLEKMPQPVVQEEEEEEEEEEEDDAEDEAALKIKEQIAALQAQLEVMTGNGKAAGAKMLASAKASLAAMPSKKTTKKRRPSESSGSTKKAGSAKKAKVPTAGPSSGTGVGSTETKKTKSKKQVETKKRDEDVRDVTYEQKEELAAKITQLPDDRLDGALKIIAEDKPPNANDDEEIELDIDDLSPQTLYKLYKYVVRPKGKKAPSKVSASDGRKRGTGGVKRKNLDEGEEAARIARLQEQLQQFDNPEAGNASSLQSGTTNAHAGAHDDLVASESSSGEESDESESDFE